MTNPESNLQDVRARFQTSVQDWLETPLDEARVLEWTALRCPQR